MKRLLFLFSLLLIVPHTFCQYQANVTLKQLLYDGKYEEAVIAALDSLESDASDPAVHYQLAKAYLGKSEYPKAFQHFKTAYRLDTMFMAALKEVGLMYNYMGQTKSAIRCFSQLIEHEPENHQAWVDLARIYRSNGYYVEAIQLYLNLIHHYPENYVYHKNLGDCYLKKNNPVKAFEFYEKAHQLNPKDLEVILRLGNLTIKSAQFNDGIEFTETGLSIDSSNTPLLKLNAYLYMLNESSDTAISRFNKCLALGDSSFFTHKYLGLSYYQKSIYDSAVVYLEQAALLDTTEIENYYYYATALSKALYKKESIDVFEKLLKTIQPSPDLVVDIYSGLAENHTYLNKHDDAITYELLLVELDDNPIWTLRVASYYEYKKKNYQKAISYYQRFIDEMGEGSENPYVKVAKNRITNMREDLFFEGKLDKDTLQTSTK